MRRGRSGARFARFRPNGVIRSAHDRSVGQEREESRLSGAGNVPSRLGLLTTRSALALAQALAGERTMPAALLVQPSGEPPPALTEQARAE
jgi:hypothetical protein